MNPPVIPLQGCVYFPERMEFLPSTEKNLQMISNIIWWMQYRRLIKFELLPGFFRHRHGTGSPYGDVHYDCHY